MNLLQPQDKRSLRAGDSPTATHARSRLLSQGVGSGVLASVGSVVNAIPLDPSSTLVDLGCGGGEMLGLLSQSMTSGLVGVELSVAAVTHAAKTWPVVTWVIANADRRLPLLDASVDVVLSIHARRNPGECARVLQPGGRLIVAVPAPDDLAELRESVYGRRLDYSRAERVIEDHSSDFAVVHRSEERSRHALAPEQLADVLASTYRDARHALAERRSSLSAMHVTLASTLLVFARR